MTGVYRRKGVEPRNIKMGQVEEIKNLGPELHIDPVAWFEDLLCGKIEIKKPGPRERVSSQVAIGPWRRPRKGAGVIVQALSVRSPGHSQRRPWGHSIVAPRIWARNIARYPIKVAPWAGSRRGIVAEARVQAGTVRRPPVPVRGTVRSIAHGKRFPRAEDANSINPPAAQNRTHHFLLEAEWKGIGGREDEIVSRVEGGARPVEARVQEIEPSVGFLA